jgi:alpha-L-fucosidase 2
MSKHKTILYSLLALILINLSIAETYANQTIWFAKPATKWSSEALGIGNGHIGGMIYGGIVKEQIQYNEKTLWSGGPGAWKDYQGGNNDSAALFLPEIRAMIARKDFSGAEKLMSAKMLGNPKAFGANQNFGNVYLDFSHSIREENISHYKRALKLDEGLIEVSYKHEGANIKRTYFCSYPDGVMVIRLTSDKAGTLSFTLNADCAHELSTITADTKSARITTGGKVSDNNMQFESIIQILDHNGQLSGNNSSLTISNADTVTILLAAATEYLNIYPHYKGGNPKEKANKLIAAASSKTYKSLLANHTGDYGNLYNRATIDLGHKISDEIPTDEILKRYRQHPTPALETLMFNYGRYLLIASSRAGSLPANLQGIWNNSNNPPWTCDYHFDINLQMNYFSSEVTNLTECSDPLVDYIYSLREPGRKTAKLHYGIENAGWVVHPMNNPFGFTAPGWESYWGWAPFTAAWICQNIWDKYLFHGDKKYLQEKIYPTMKEQAEFWLKWLIPDAEGYLVSSPSVSPEHLPVSDGPTCDISMCYELFTDVIEASIILNTDKDLRKKLIKARGRLLPPKIGSWGQIQEWKYDWDKQNEKHRHVSHLVQVYQGERINPETTPELFEAAKVSLQARDNIPGDIHGWSMAQRIGLWGRLLEPEKAHRQLVKLLNGFVTPNLLTLTGGVFQIEANLGIPGLMSEMLIQSHLGYISLLPATPVAWKNGAVKGLCARGGFEVDMRWKDLQITSLKLLSKNGNNCSIKINNQKNRPTIIDLHNNKTVKYKAKDGIITFKTVKGRNYQINNL